MAEQTQNPHALQSFQAAQSFHQAGDLDRAVLTYRIAIAADETFVEAHANMGFALHDQGKLVEAADCFRRALELNPDIAEVHYGFGTLLQELNQTEEALTAFRRAIGLKPDFPEAMNGEAIVLQSLGDWAGAEAALTRAIDINPDFAIALNNLGNLYHKQGRLKDAEDHFRRALALTPDYAEAHRNLSLILRLTGRLEEGWRESLWRWKCRDFPTKERGFPQPRWSGEPVDGKKIVVWGEQGVGDQVYFAAMIPDLIERGANVVLETEHRLTPLFQRSFPDAVCVSHQNPPAPETGDGTDFQAALGDLGLWLRPNEAAFPGRRSYLAADKARTERLRAQYRAGGDTLLVGIGWHSKNPEIGAQKSLSLMDWQPLTEVPGVTFIDLQYGDTADERARFERETGTALHHDAGIDQMADLDAFAAQIAALDLVISISCTAVHIAGALGVPTWVLLNTPPLSCWMLERDDSPWYPSVKLLRQKQTGDWADVIGRAAAGLAEFPRS